MSFSIDRIDIPIATLRGPASAPVGGGLPAPLPGESVLDWICRVDGDGDHHHALVAALARLPGARRLDPQDDGGWGFVGRLAGLDQDHRVEALLWLRQPTRSAWADHLARLPPDLHALASSTTFEVLCAAEHAALRTLPGIARLVPDPARPLPADHVQLWIHETDGAPRALRTAEDFPQTPEPLPPPWPPEALQDPPAPASGWPARWLVLACGVVSAVVAGGPSLHPSLSLPTTALGLGFLLAIVAPWRRADGRPLSTGAAGLLVLGSLGAAVLVRVLAD